MTTKRLSICFYAPAENIHTTRWCSALAQRGHKVCLVPMFPGKKRTFEDLNDVEIINIDYPTDSIGKLPILRNFVRSQRFRRRLENINADVYHMHWLNLGWSAKRCFRNKKPLIISVWGADVVSDVQMSDLKYYEKRNMLLSADLICATSHFLKLETENYCRGKKEIQVVPFGVDINKFKPGDLREKQPVVGFLKHLEPKYGADILIRAMKSVLKYIPDAKLIVAGKGSKENELKELAKKIGISDSVQFIGQISHKYVPNVINTFSVMAMPSIYQSETFGVSAIEAQACGVPVIASNVGGVPEAIIDKKTGILVPPGDPDALAAAILKVLNDEKLRIKMGNDGREYVKAKYNWSQNVQDMERIYLKVSAKQK